MAGKDPAHNRCNKDFLWAKDRFLGTVTGFLGTDQRILDLSCHLPARVLYPSMQYPSSVPLRSLRAPFHFCTDVHETLSLICLVFAQHLARMRQSFCARTILISVRWNLGPVSARHAHQS